jgi:branched-chain amino acid transport system ATP-binding protein
MNSVRAHGHAILLVEQNFALAMAVADYVHVVASGRFVFQGTPGELARAADVLDHHLGVSASDPRGGPAGARTPSGPSTPSTSP